MRMVVTNVKITGFLNQMGTNNFAKLKQPFPVGTTKLALPFLEGAYTLFHVS